MPAMKATEKKIIKNTKKAIKGDTIEKEKKTSLRGCWKGGSRW